MSKYPRDKGASHLFFLRFGKIVTGTICDFEAQMLEDVKSRWKVQDVKAMEFLLMVKVGNPICSAGHGGVDARP